MEYKLMSLYSNSPETAYTQTLYAFSRVMTEYHRRKYIQLTIKTDTPENRAEKERHYNMHRMYQNDAAAAALRISGYDARELNIIAIEEFYSMRPTIDVVKQYTDMLKLAASSLANCPIG
jgi:hypothetical protein